jgi:hypothetical protein
MKSSGLLQAGRTRVPAKAAFVGIEAVSRSERIAM